MDSSIETEKARYEKAFEVVHANLKAENWFFETVKGKLGEVAPVSDFPTISGPSALPQLLNLTRFLFFLRALDCTDPEKIGTLIDLHNQTVESELAKPDFNKSVTEFKKAFISEDRKKKIVETVREFGSPVFAISDYGHFLIETMSPKTTEKLIEDLRFGQVLLKCVDNRIDADQKRVLIKSVGFLEDTYVSSQIRLRSQILASACDTD